MEEEDRQLPWAILFLILLFEIAVEDCPANSKYTDEERQKNNWHHIVAMAFVKSEAETRFTSIAFNIKCLKVLRETHYTEDRRLVSKSADRMRTSEEGSPLAN